MLAPHAFLHRTRNACHLRPFHWVERLWLSWQPPCLYTLALDSKEGFYVHPVNRTLGSSERMPPRLHPAIPNLFSSQETAFALVHPCPMQEMLT